MNSIRTRLAIASSACVGIMFLLSGFALVGVVRRDQASSIDAQLNRQAQAITNAGFANRLATRNQPPNGTPDPGPGNTLRRALAAPGLSARVTVDGIITNETGDAPDDVFANSSDGIRTVETSEGSWRVLTKLRNGPRRTSLVQLASPLTLADQAADSLRRQVVRLGIVVIIIAGLIGWGIGTLVTRPLARLSSRARDVAGTADLSTRVNEDGPDEVAAVADSLNTMLARLEQSSKQTLAALDTSRAFSANVAHELRTPLTSMRANLDSLANPHLPVAENREVLNEILDEHERLVATLEALLQLARGDTGPISSAQSVDLAELTEAAVASAKQHFPSSSFSLNAPNDAVSLPGWSEGLRLMLDNLLINAAIHGGNDGRRVQVQLTIARALSAIDLWVDDNGPGIPVEERSRVRERFARGTTKVRGSGLGLALVEQQVSLHNGQLNIQDSPLGGARFHIRFPL